MSNNPIKIDFDLGALLDPEIIIIAAETDDDIGCVLRLHLQVEKFLDLFLDQARKGEIAEFVKPPRDFGAKLSVAVALGLPIPFAKVAKRVNTVRNQLAHNHKSLIDPEEVKRLGQTVNKVQTLIPELHLVERQFIELYRKRPNEKYVYGQGNLRLDFFISVSTFLNFATPWLIKRFAPHHITNDSNTQACRQINRLEK